MTLSIGQKVILALLQLRAPEDRRSAVESVHTRECQLLSRRNDPLFRLGVSHSKLGACPEILVVFAQEGINRADFNGIHLLDLGHLVVPLLPLVKVHDEIAEELSDERSLDR